ncbi:MAG: Npt1/Npt2 family nucleotide transporter [Pseudomonadota bacterium]
MPVATIDKLLWSLFKVRPVEKRRALLMALYLLAAVSAFIMGRITRDSLFLSRFDKSLLAYNYVTVAAAVALPAFFYTRIADRYRRDRLILVVLGILFSSLLISRVLAGLGYGWFYFVFYNWIEVLGAFLMIQFWTFASDVFSSREAKRIFPFIVLVGVLANPLCGGGVRGLVPLIGTENLILLQAGMLAICIICVVLLGREQRDRIVDALTTRRTTTTIHAVGGMLDDVRTVFKSKHLQIVAAITAITFVSTQFIDFAFKSIARDHFRGDELTTFFSEFFLYTGLLGAAIQFFVTRRLLERFGVVVALLVLPIALFGFSAVGFSTAGALWAATLAKGSENSLRYSLYDATMQVLYTAVPSEIRGRAKALIDGILKPVAMGLAGGVLVVVINQLHMPVSRLFMVALGFIAAWIVLVVGIKREYVRQLMANLRKRRLNFEESNFEISDQRTIELLGSTLRSSRDREVLDALELVPRVRGGELLHDVAQLTTHCTAQIRQSALRLLSGGEAVAIHYLDLVHDRFTDTDDDVRAQAIRSFCALTGERAIPTVRRYLADPSPLVRAAAVAGMMRHGGLDGILSSADEFKAMLRDSSPLVRRQAAWVLGEIRVRNFFQPVLDLMQDRDSSVQNAAIAAASEMRSPELIPVLIYKLARRDTARAALLALTRYGDEVLPVLGKVLAHVDEDIVIRRQVPRVLATIASRASLDILLSNLGVRDGGLRWEVARAAARLRDRLQDIHVGAHQVKPFLLDEVRDHYQTMAALADIGGLDLPTGVDLLSDALRERLDRNLDRIFRFLSILYPLRTIDLVFRNLHSPSKIVRANAAELLDNLLDKEIGRLILPILDEGSAEQKISFGADAFEIARRPRTEWLGAFLESDDTWLRVCALYDIGETGLRDFVPQVESGLRDPDPVIRETSVRALSVLQQPRQFVRCCQLMLEDADVTVRRYALSLLAVADPRVMVATGSGLGGAPSPTTLT